MADETHETQETLRWEYREVATSHRFYVGLRFVIAAFTATLQSTLLKIYGDSITQLGKPVNEAAEVILFDFRFFLQGHPLSFTIIGFFTMIATFFMERRTIGLFRVMIDRGRLLELKLLLLGGQFSQLSGSRGIRFFTYTWSLNAIYIVLGMMWLYLLVLNFIALY